MTTLTLSEQVYQRLQTLAQQRGQTPEDVIESLLTEQETRQPQPEMFSSLEEMMRASGMSEEDIAWVEAQPIELEPGDEYERADL
jgi:predicted transcriptional regulator